MVSRVINIGFPGKGMGFCRIFGHGANIETKSASVTIFRSNHKTGLLSFNCLGLNIRNPKARRRFGNFGVSKIFHAHTGMRTNCHTITTLYTGFGIPYGNLFRY
jgi:hypothetical protein